MGSYFENREQCPCCLSTNHKTIYQISYSDPSIRKYFHELYENLGPGVEFEYLEGADYVVQECGECGALFQRDVPGTELMERLYEHWLDPKTLFDIYRSERNARYFRSAANQIAMAIDATRRLPANVKFLDFGMGWGYWSAIAKGFGCDVYGCELSDARTENANRLGIKVLAPEEIEGMKFDVINVEQVLEHLVTPYDLLVDLKQVLDIGGVIRTSVPHCADLKHRLSIADWGAPFNGKNSLNDIAPLQHINFFSNDSLLVMGRKAGLEKFRNTDGSRVKNQLRNVKYKAHDMKRYIERSILKGKVKSPNVSSALFCHAEES